MKLKLNKEYLTNDDHQVKHLQDEELLLKIICLDNNTDLPITARQIHPNPLYNNTLWYLTETGRAMRGSGRVAIFRIMEEVIR
jgi:hypothetical protein